jgi:quercetin dioxygenase-like cupin family protein
MNKYKTALIVFGVILISSTMSFAQLKDSDYKIIHYAKTIEDGKPLSKRMLDKGNRQIIAEVTLRDGKALGVHTENTPFMVYGIAGEGVLVLGDNEKSIPITPGVLVTVETGVAHDVVAKPNLSILVFKLIGNSEMNKEHENHENNEHHQD